MTRFDDGRRGEADEARPLISPPTEACEPASVPFLSSSPSHHRTRCTWPWLYVVALCFVAAMIYDIGDLLYVAPRIRLFESVTCTRYYLETDPSLVDENGAVPERLCKVNPVQSEVSSVLGWQFFFDSLPAILLPIPYGYLADTYGRKWILVLSMVGCMLSYVSTIFFLGVLHLPLRYAWISSLFFLIGGGPTIGTTLITTIVADVVPPEIRSTVFFYRFCSDLIPGIVVPPITSILMSRSIWIPLFGSMLFQAVCIVVLFVVPETLPITNPKQAGDVLDCRPVVADTLETSEETTLEKKIAKWARQAKESFSFIARDANVAALVLTFFISKVGRQASNIMFQYASKRYGWSLSQANLIYPLISGVNLALFTAILPGISTYGLARFSPAHRDLLIAKGSIILMLLGAIGLFLSVTPAILTIGIVLFICGSGFPPVARSLATFLVESHEDNSATDIGRLYAVISAMEGIGSLVAAPGMAFAFRIGMNMGQQWLGMPFAFAGSLFLLVSIIVFNIKLEKE